ncbi:hypothetical protein QQ054_26205 [Oscillatoria amoena NRMC-F 0135]|nr:hypothetical protein [Oscillatoria amoena NRMC-F 0135]
MAQEQHPIPPKMKSSMIAHFNHAYKNGLNLSTENKKLDVKWDIVKKYIDFDNLKDKIDFGVGLFYTLPANKSYFSYIIAKAQVINDTIIPVPIFNNSYLMLGPNSALAQEISSQEIITYMNLYKDNVEVRQWPTNNTLEIKDLSNYPKVCFFEGRKFYEFITQNIDLTLGNTSTYDLTVYNGSINTENISHTNTNLYSIDIQTPLLIIENNDQPALSSEFNITKPYSNKALDVGRLCPPDC